MSFGPLVSTNWLADNLGAADLKVIDGSWRMPGQGAAIESYRQEHIPGAVFFDIDAVADTASPLPHMAPSPEDFAEAVGALGVTPTDRVVVYDEKGLFSAARVWWTFRAMGHDAVGVLSGGLPKWRREGRALTDEETVIKPAVYMPGAGPSGVATCEDVRDALAAGVTVLDARPHARFSGAAPEPRAGLRSGHMPGALNLPFSDLIGEDSALKGADELRAIFTAKGVSRSTRVITSCGSGVTAAVLSLALDVIGNRNHALYDGSWSEWGDESHDNDLFPLVADAKD